MSHKNAVKDPINDRLTVLVSGKFKFIPILNVFLNKSIWLPTRLADGLRSLAFAVRHGT